MRDIELQDLLWECFQGVSRFAPAGVFVCLTILGVSSTLAPNNLVIGGPLTVLSAIFCRQMKVIPESTREDFILTNFSGARGPPQVNSEHKSDAVNSASSLRNKQTRE